MSTFLVLGGIGFIGRNFVAHLLEKGVSPANIRVVDKVLPATAWLNETHKAAIDKIEFRQANLVSPASIEKAFARDDGKPWDVVVNLAAETKYSQSESVYEEKIVMLSTNCAKEAAKNKSKLFIEVSTAQVYDGDKKNLDEGGKVKPWTGIGKAKAKAEEELKKIAGLNLVIVRPASSPRLICGHIYRHLKEEMKLLWTKDLRINTVHVNDVCAALWALSQHYQDKPANGEVYNLADKEDTDQETINAHIRNIFGIQTGFQGSIVSQFAKLNLESVTEEVNDTHMAPWSELLKASNIANSPLTPYLDQELLYNNHLSIVGTKIESVPGFSYSVPKVTEERLREVVDGYKKQGIWPNN
ncbi:NAD-dependent epimerase/dehydratase [Catenaria anguillulae PL171]|uniref:NAD-dependent epimerase/dehydratase n=1 Tax=Catenaria anguillulae PL171 TaxID=765915 RepID=A0A1Y2HZX6_9FUNG|nr:NAD-dependent epimerase/dehydratase [Catenaria anguillulae PL171]